MEMSPDLLMAALASLDDDIREAERAADEVRREIEAAMAKLAADHRRFAELLTATGADEGHAITFHGRAWWTTAAGNVCHIRLHESPRTITAMKKDRRR